jgi:glycosyltransferase involved in cell wall biosynthesis
LKVRTHKPFSELHSQVRRYNILLIAEAANPEWASVPLVGWSLYRALANVVNVHLATHIRNRDAIIRAGLIEGRDFTAIDNERVVAPLFKIAQKLRGGAGKGWTTNTAFSSIAYYSFELELWRQFKRRFAAHEFNLVHRITPLSPTSQSVLARRLARLNIPFVIGPLNGGVPWPKHFKDRQYAEREWLSHVRWVYRFMPGYRSTRWYSAAIIVGSKHTYEEMPNWAKHKCVYIPENGVDLDRLEFSRNRALGLPLRGAFVGRLVPYKGADILLEAAADFLRNGQLELHIIGDGPQRAFLESMAEGMGIRDSVRFHGWISHTDVQEWLKSCDFMALPSIREFGGGVVVESMALGVSPIVANYGGPSELVDEKTGIRISFDDKNSLVEGLRLAIGNVVRAPKILSELGAAAVKKVRETLTWKAKANQVAAVYDGVLSGKTDLSFLNFFD